LDGKLKAFSDFLGDRSFFAGDHVTHPDFHMYEMLWSHNKLAPELMQVSNRSDFLISYTRLTQT
jgi:glutathione S-transferase